MNGPIFRSDINTFVEQAKFADSLQIGLLVAPPTPVNQIAGKYLKLNIANASLLRLNQPQPRAWGTEAPVINTGFDSDGYECYDYAAKQRVDDILNNYTSQFGLDQLVISAKLIARWQRLNIEQQVANTLFNTANFTLLTASVSYTNALVATANFPLDFENARLNLVKLGQDPMQASVILPLPLYNYITQTTLYQYFIRGNRPNDSFVQLVPTEANVGMMAALLGVKKVYIGQAYADTSNPGQKNYSMSALWNPAYFWMGVVEGGQFESGGAARFLYYDQAGGMLSTKTYYRPEYRSTDVEISLFGITKVIDSTAGVLTATGYTGS